MDPDSAVVWLNVELAPLSSGQVVRSCVMPVRAVGHDELPPWKAWERPKSLTPSSKRLLRKEPPNAGSA